MTIEQFVSQWGLLGLFGGALLEGETFAILGGLFARRGLLSLPLVMLVLTVGSFTADQIWFYLGRHFREHPRVKRMLAGEKARQALAMLERRPIPFLFSFRFIWGIRTVSPIIIGTSNVSARLYLLLNALAAVSWALIFSTIGYALGRVAEQLLGSLARFEHVMLVAVLPLLLLALLGAWAGRRIAGQIRKR